MATMTLNLQKAGDAPKPKLQLSLNKEARFKIELEWDSEADLDTHALLAFNDGNGAKVSAFEQILSTYNVKRPDNQGVLVARNPDGSPNEQGKGWFETPCGTLRHSGDSRRGDLTQIDEVIDFDGSRCPNDRNEIPLFVLIHSPPNATFADVKSGLIRIKDQMDKEIGSYRLSDEFKAFKGIQLGSILRSANGWEFAAAGTGFNGDFNTVLAHFS
jgi:tellurium resistance protein TerD